MTDACKQFPSRDMFVFVGSCMPRRPLFLLRLDLVRSVMRFCNRFRLFGIVFLLYQRKVMTYVC